jgi:hypothetical protein
MLEKADFMKTRSQKHALTLLCKRYIVFTIKNILDIRIQFDIIIYINSL